jgi:glycosyltransferase involved in cell wall biosynthesis
MPWHAHALSTGRLVEPRDADALAAALIEVLTDDLRARTFAANGFERVRKRFSVERMVQDTLAVYETLQ